VATSPITIILTSGAGRRRQAMFVAWSRVGRVRVADLEAIRSVWGEAAGAARSGEAMCRYVGAQRN